MDDASKPHEEAIINYFAGILAAFLTKSELDEAARTVGSELEAFEQAIREPLESRLEALEGLLRRAWEDGQSMAGCNACGEGFDDARGFIGHLRGCWVAEARELVEARRALATPDQDGTR